MIRVGTTRLIPCNLCPIPPSLTSKASSPTFPATLKKRVHTLHHLPTKPWWWCIVIFGSENSTTRIVWTAKNSTKRSRKFVMNWPRISTASFTMLTASGNRLITVTGGRTTNGEKEYRRLSAKLNHQVCAASQLMKQASHLSSMQRILPTFFLSMGLIGLHRLMPFALRRNQWLAQWPRIWLMKSARTATSAQSLRVDHRATRKSRLISPTIKSSRPTTSLGVNTIQILPRMVLRWEP